MQSDNFVPAVAEVKVDAKGFGLTTGASWGCGGGTERCISSRSTYVPTELLIRQTFFRTSIVHTFTDGQLVFKPRRVTYGIRCFDERSSH